MFLVSCHVAADKELIVTSRHFQVPKYHICMTRNIMLCTPKNFNFLKNFKFQCEHSHNYHDFLFHVFADHLMSSPKRADPEHNMRESLMLFINKNREKVTTIAALFLKKKLSLDEYIKFMSTPGNWGNELPYIFLL